MLQNPSLHRGWLQAGCLCGEGGGEGKSKSHKTLSMKTRKSYLLLDLACAVPHPGNGWEKWETLKSPGVSPETSS